MSITKFIVSKIETEKNKQNTTTENVCTICGGKDTNDRDFCHKKDQLSANFNDINEFENKESDMICGYCQFCLDGKAMVSPKGKPCGMRLYSFFVDENNFVTIDKSEREYYLFEKEYNSEFVLAFSETGQKHISFKSKISSDTNKFYVCTDTSGNILFDRKAWTDVYKRSKELYNLGVPKKTLLGEIDPRWMKKYGLTFSDISVIRKNCNNMCYILLINSISKDK